MKKRIFKKAVALMVGCALSAVLFTACGSTAGSSAAPASSAAAEPATSSGEKEAEASAPAPASTPESAPEAEVTASGEAHIATSMAWDSLDLCMTTSLGSRQVSQGSLWEKLVTQNADGEPVPELCETFEMTDDAKTFTFKLRTDVKFHDGSDMLAEDVVASMNRWIENYDIVANLVGGGRFEEIDEHTVAITTDAPALTLPDMIAGAAVCPIITTKEACEDLTDEGFLKTLIGTGPYKFTETVQDQYTRFDRFEDYAPYGDEGYLDGMAGHKVATIQTLYYSFVKDAQTRITGLQTGEYDLIYSLSSDLYDVIANTPGMETQKEGAGGLLFVLNKKSGLCTDVNFRKAVNAAFSMDDILTVGYGSFYELDSNYMDKMNGFWLTDAGSECYNQADEELAKKYLAESSYNQGDTFRILTTNENNRDKLALVAADQLEKIGIPCEVSAYDYPTMMSYMRDPETYDLAVMSYSAVPIPTLKLYLGEGERFWTTDETYLDYVDQFNAATTKDEAKEIWEKIQAYCWEEYVPVICTGHYQECYAWNGGTLDNVHIYNNTAHMWTASLK